MLKSQALKPQPNVKARLAVKFLLQAIQEVGATNKELDAIATTIDVLVVAYDLPENILDTKSR